MTRTDDDLTESLRFQLSLLRLAVVPHGPSTPGAPASTAAKELAKLAEKVPEPSRRRSRA